MAITNVLAEVTVVDFDAALAWYERLFGRPADRRPMDGLAEWQVTETDGVQVFHDPERGGGAVPTLIVDDLDARIADLAGRGFRPGAITTGEVGRFAIRTDPEGNTITFAGSLSTDASIDLA
ncbi:MAG: VOC family protein [Chloroflexia bacterium]|nr:VOC family protein [Chloroflexia bacterium]